MIRLHGLLRLSSLFVAIATATAAHALGVGEVSLNSRLNQPLNAKIALFEASGLDANEVTVKLASPEAFERVGLDRPYFLTDLKFSPTLQGAQGNIIVSSSKPVREPYLSFLIEVIWPNGRMLREYTLLLDPPLYTPTQQVATPTPAKTAPAQQPARSTAATTTAPPAQPPRAAQSSSSPATQPEQQPVQTARTPSTEPSQTASTSNLQPGGQYHTQPNDTLWGIANNISPSAATLNQTMLAIQDLNPQAFINSNINLLKKGEVLRLPDEQQINSRSAAVALRQVVEQNNAWQESRGQTAQRQINATNREISNAQSQQPTDNLRLVSANSEGTSALNERLAAAQENLDSSRRENAELQSRVSDLQDQLDKLQRLVELKDANLANLQAQLASNEANAAASNSPSVPINNADNAPPATQETTASPEPTVATTSTPATSNTANETALDNSAAQSEQQPVTTANSDNTEEPQWWESLLENQAVVWGAGGVGLLLILLLLMAQSRRNAKKWAERELEAELAAEDGKQATDFTAGLDLPDPSFNELLPQEPAKEEPFSAHAAADDSGLDEFLLPNEPKPSADKSNTLDLDDFADFDLKLADEPKSNKTPPLLDLPEKHEFTQVRASKTDDLPSQDKADEFDFIAEDKSFSDSLDDFGLDDKAPVADPAPADKLHGLDFAELDDIAAPSAQAKPAQAKAEPQQPSKVPPEETFKPADKLSDDDFDFLSGTDETETKLDLARAYIDMGDMEGARDILDEVMSEGSDSQQAEARELMTSLA